MRRNDGVQAAPRQIRIFVDSTAGGALWPSSAQFAAAIQDFIETARKWPMWTGLGFQEIRMRYRRTALGPFWMTLNMGLTVVMIGLVFGQLFQSNIGVYMPYLVSGVVVWNFILALMNEGANCYISFNGYIKQARQPYALYIMIVMWRNFLAFLHNLVIVPLILLYFWVVPSWTIIFVPLGLMLVIMTVLPYAMLVGIIAARFRDIPQLVTNVMTALFFVSPVIWKVEALGKHSKLAYLNPIAHLLEIVRAPLLGQPPAWFVAPCLLLMLVLGWSVLFLVFARFRARIAYWV